MCAILSLLKFFYKILQSKKKKNNNLFKLEVQLNYTERKTKEVDYLISVMRFFGFIPKEEEQNFANPKLTVVG